MSPRRSKTIVRPSGETSSDIHVPVDVSNVRSFAVARRAETSHLAGTVGAEPVCCCARAEATPVASARSARSGALVWRIMRFLGVGDWRRKLSRAGGQYKTASAEAYRTRVRAINPVLPVCPV